MPVAVTYTSLIAEAKTLISSCASDLEGLLSGAAGPEGAEHGTLGQDELRAGVRLSNRIAVIAGLLAFRRLRDLAAAMRSAFLLSGRSPRPRDAELLGQAASLLKMAARALDPPKGYGEMLRPDGTAIRPPLKRDIDAAALCVDLNRGQLLALTPFDGRFLEEGPMGQFRVSIDPERAETSRNDGKWLSLAYFDGGDSGENGPLGLSETANSLIALVARGEVVRYGGLSMSYAGLCGVRAILPCYCLLETAGAPEDVLAQRMPGARLLKIVSSPAKAFAPDPGADGPPASAFSVYAARQSDSLSLDARDARREKDTPQPVEPAAPAFAEPFPEPVPAFPDYAEEAPARPARQAPSIDPDALDKELPPGIVFPEMHEDESEGLSLEDFKSVEHEIHGSPNGLSSGSAEQEALLGGGDDEPAPEPASRPERELIADRFVAEERPMADSGRKKARAERIEITRDMRIRLPIAVKLITIISLLIFLSLGTMIGLASYFFRQEIKNQVADSSLQLAEVIRQKFDSDFQAVSDKGSRFVQEYLDMRLSPGTPLPDDKSASIFGTDREILYAGAFPEGGGPAAASLANRQALKDLQIDENALTAYIESRRAQIARGAAGENLCLNASALFREPAVMAILNYKASGGNGSLVIVFLSKERLQGSVESKRKSIRQQYLLSLDGELLAHPDASLVVQGLDYSVQEPFKTIQDSGAPTGQSSYADESGISYSATYSRLRSMGAWVVSAVEEKRAFEAIGIIQRNNIFLAVMVLAVAILMVYFYAKTLTIPIRALVGAARRIEAGQFALELRARAHDEVGLLTQSFVKMGKGLAERERLKDTFGKFVNKEIAEQAQRGTLKLGGERKRATVFFSDIRGFTSISEKLEPEEVVEFLNKYMTRMVKCVNSTGGLVDKYIGDAIMAVWGVTAAEGVNEASSAVNAALMMRKELIDFNRDRGGPHTPLIRIGCGINSGPVISGQIGSEERMEYTVIGDTVNLASRIEALNKPFGTDILVSQETYDRVRGEFRMERMKPIMVKGKLEPQMIYAVLGRLDDPYCPRALSEVQSLLGIEHKDISGVDVDAEEVKYKIVEPGAKGGAR